MIELIKRIFHYPFARFLVAGGINTIFGYLCFAVLMYIFNWKELAVTLNYLIAIAFNYFMSSNMVFNSKKTSLNKIFKFYLVYIITYPINLLHLYITVDIWHWNVYVSQFVSLFYIPVISYLLQKKLVFSEPTKK